VVGGLFDGASAHMGGRIASAVSALAAVAAPTGLGRRQARFTMDEQALILEYEHLRRKARELDVQVESVDRRLVEIEGQLPDWYTFPGDPPLNVLRRLPPDRGSHSREAAASGDGP